MTLAYHATRGRVHVRILAYRPALYPLPDDHLRVVIQAVDHGHPIAEDPIHIETAPALMLARELHLMRCEGWDLTPWKDAA